MLKKLRIKFVCIMMSIVTLMLVTILGVIVHFTGTNLQRESVQMLHNVATNPIMSMRPDSRGEKINLPFFIIQADRNGNMAVINNGFFDLSDEAVVREIVAAAQSGNDETGVIKAYSLRYYRAENPMGQQYVFADISSESTMMANLVRTCAAIGVAAFVVFLALSWFLSGWAIKPVESAWTQQKQFVADASHELKTPLTVILTNAELIQSAEYEEKDKQQFAATVLTMSQHMRSLVEGLLDLARVDNGIVKGTVETVDYSALCEDTLLPFEPVFFEKQRLLESDIENGITVKGSAGHLRQVTEIMLDNAIKYSYTGTTVTVKLRRLAGQSLLTVNSIGDTIPSEDLKNIFKRFYRADKSRSRDGSFGLGLAIAESVVAEHGGKIWAESTNGSNTFFVQLPINNK